MTSKRKAKQTDQEEEKEKGDALNTTESSIDPTKHFPLSTTIETLMADHGAETKEELLEMI
jgi:hypothetical protein